MEPPPGPVQQKSDQIPDFCREYARSPHQMHTFWSKMKVLRELPKKY